MTIRVMLADDHAMVRDALAGILSAEDDMELVGIAGDGREAVARALALRPDVLIIDPPRGGMHPKTVTAVQRLSPERIVHVSCNPATLARDVRLLCNGGYWLERLQPLDMFPQTCHVETVVKLVRI